MDTQQAVTETESYIFNLKNAIEVSKDGAFVETAAFEFAAPAMSDFKHSSRLSQMIMRAIMDSQDFGDPEAMRKAAEEFKSGSVEEEMDASSVKVILLASKSIELSQVGEVFTGLAIRVGKADAGVPLTAANINRVTPDEFIDMMCGYIAHFICPSLFTSEG